MCEQFSNKEENRARKKGRLPGIGGQVPKPESQVFSQAEKEAFMREALVEARRAASLGEVPIGAVIVREGKIIARGHNLTETNHDPTEHAEMRAIRAAAEQLGGWRLAGCCMFVTCEPCSMCAGALVWSRIETLYIGAMDPTAGACGSVFNIAGSGRLNHTVRIEQGILEEECGAELRAFFAGLRSKRKKKTVSEE